MAAGPAEAQDAFDARTRERAAAHATTPTRATRALERSLGSQAVVDVDALTRTPRMLARLDGTLTGPRRGDPVELAQRYVREHLPALGLTTADLGSLGGLRRVALPGGGEQVRWRQYHAGIPALDNELRVTVMADGAILNVIGPPQHDLEPELAAPRLSAQEALRAAGASSAPPVLEGPAGPRRTTRFDGGDEAALVLFGEGDRARLAWRVIHRESSQAVWDVVVDAGSGRVLRRANQVKQVTVFERHPGAPAEGVWDLEQQGWLSSSTRLSGPNARAWSDADDDDAVDAGEEVVPDDYGQQTFQSCTPFPCTWNSALPSTWQANRAQGTVQVFYYVNRFHDWLRDRLQFVEGAFEVEDRLFVQTFDGAALNPQHRNNANMFTPPDGQPPVMQMYLFDTRDVHGGDDAAIVYHEYTHGLTNRLVTDADGWGALNSPQAAAMGEGWSDFFAMDFLVSNGYQADNPAIDGQVDLDAYTQSGSRYKAIDCSVGPCGGFTYANFGKIAGQPEVHADGEIWGQTLWDLRRRVGAQTARRLVYAALSLAPPEPSFLDMRNAILLANQMIDTPASEATVWDVFADRGMGWFAGTEGSSDVNPGASTLGLPSGGPALVRGRVIDADNGRPIAGATVRVGGHGFTAKADAGGAFTVGPVPAGTYESVTASAPAGHDPETFSDVAAPRSGVEFRLRRNWAAGRSNARVHSVDGVGTETTGCRPEQAIDQDPGTGFSAVNDGSPPTVVLRLPQLVAVTGFAVDPGNACGDPAGSTTARFGIAVSEDGATWQAERQYALGVGAAHVRNLLPAGAGAGRVRFVRLRMLAAADPRAPFIDFTELSVYGNALPALVGLAARTPVRAGEALALTALGAQDADGAIVQYRWDFDGNGSVDQTTPSGATTFAYAAPGSYGATVTAVDDRGGLGSASTVVVVTQASPSPPALRKPAIRLPRSGRRARLTVRVRCEAACTGTLRLRVDRRTARTLRLGRVRTIGSARVRLKAAGERRITLKLSRKAVRALKRARRRVVRASLSASVVDVGGRSTTARRRVRVRR